MVNGLQREDDVRVTTAFSRLLGLKGVWVRNVRFDSDGVAVTVALRRRRLLCPRCAYATRARFDTRRVDSVWRHLDLGAWRLDVCCRRRRLCCPEHGVLAESVPFARPGSGFTRDFEALVAWLAAKTDKSTVRRLVRIDWDTVGRIIQRVCAEQLDPDRLEGLFDIGIDEVSWRKQHKYLTLVVDHHARKVVWGTEGAGADAATEFFDDLDPELPEPDTDTDTDADGDAQLQLLDLQARSSGAEGPRSLVGPRATQLTAISMDMGPGYALAARKFAPQAIICIDPYHVIALANRALDDVRRSYWNALRDLNDPEAAKAFKDARWVLLKNPENLTDKQAAVYQELKQAGGDVWDAYTLKEALRGTLAAGLALKDVTARLDQFIIQAADSTLAPFIRLSKTIARHRDGILAAIRLGITNARTEAMNNKVRLITRRAYGFHSAKAALALVMLTCGPITLQLPHEITR
jgi:transposase